MPIPLPTPHQEPVRQPGGSATQDRADHAGEASALHREIHDRGGAPEDRAVSAQRGPEAGGTPRARDPDRQGPARRARSEEHTSELQSRGHLVCRLLLEKKKKNNEEKNYDNNQDAE